MRIYVATSWTNEHQNSVVTALRADGHTVYDFRDAEGFHWDRIDPAWKDWTPAEYISGLSHPYADNGFKRDMDALRQSEACVMVMPCGLSAGIEMGWAVAAGKRVFVYVPALRQPDLMVKMAELVTSDLDEIRQALRTGAP